MKVTLGQCIEALNQIALAFASGEITGDQLVVEQRAITKRLEELE